MWCIARAHCGVIFAKHVETTVRPISGLTVHHMAFLPWSDQDSSRQLMLTRR